MSACPYCGPGPCRSTARTADGADLERFERHHPRPTVTPAECDHDPAFSACSRCCSCEECTAIRRAEAVTP